LKRWSNRILFLLLYLLILCFVYFIGLSRYIDRPIKSKEVVLMQGLWTMRRAIDFYWQDKERPPQSLQELVRAGYLREIPADPFTKSTQTWVIEREKEADAASEGTPGVSDVHSGAAGADRDGKAYNRY
jgi:general secretion pathway protein G